MRILKGRVPRLFEMAELEEQGYYITAPVDTQTIESIQSIYSPRSSSVIRKDYGHPFVNLFRDDDISFKNPVFKLAFSPKILDVASDYFGDKLILDSIQVLYSYSTDGDIRESQLWHLDYGDRKSFHAIIYLNDVNSLDDGPFVFIDKPTSKTLGRSFVIRRLCDERFLDSFRKEDIKQFFGKAGAMVYVDPSACYHYGSRCEEFRLAVFVTFSTWFPFAQPVSLININREKIFQEAKLVRPDLNEKFLRTLLQLD